MFKHKTIQTKLFVSYSTFILLIIVAFIAYYYFDTARALESKASNALYQLSGYIMSQLDGELQNMNSLSNKILFSQPLKELFYSDMYDLGNNANGIYSQRKFNEILYSITGPQVPVTQINMIRLNGNFAGLGSNNTFTALPPGEVDKMPWMDEILRQNGYKFISVPHKDSGGPHARDVISLNRSFAAEFGKKPDSVIEIQQDYSVFTGIITKALNTPDVKKAITQKVYVFNREGGLVYPRNGALTIDRAALAQYWEEINARQGGPSTFSISGAQGGGRTILAYTGSAFSGWTAVVSESESIMLSPVLALRNRTMLASAGILLISLALSYFVARGLTIPIKKIHRSIKSLSLDTITGTEAAHSGSGLNEFEDLNRSFAEMCKRLKSSLEEAVSARSHEIQAQMLALQSQMNPHFLYNTITVISIMAEDEGNGRVVNACLDLSGMLRYISAGSGGCVTVKEELEHTVRYLNLMKIRYRDKLGYRLDIPENMMEVTLPKLVIQPLVENSTKYAIHRDPPWEIEIRGRVTGDRWEISVHDNGQGFEGKFLADMKEKFESANTSEMLPGLKLDGMGLMNIFLRLRLMYGENAAFHLCNRPGGGATVTIGGPI